MLSFLSSLSSLSPHMHALRDIVSPCIQDCECRDTDPPCGLYYDNQIFQQPAYLPNITSYYTNFSIDFMQNASEAQQPFFLYLAYHQTHHPQFASLPFVNSSARAGGRPNAFGDSVLEMDHNIGVVCSVVRTMHVPLFFLL